MNTAVLAHAYNLESDRISYGSASVYTDLHHQLQFKMKFGVKYKSGLQDKSKNYLGR